MSERTRTDKDALGQFLVRRLSEEDPTGAPLTVAELRRQLLPYPVCREELDFATKAEYDQAVLKLLSDDTWLVIEDEALQEALEEERASPEPGLAFLGDFSPSFLHPGPRLTGDAVDDDLEDAVEDDLEFLEELGADGTSAEEPAADPAAEEDAAGAEGQEGAAGAEGEASTEATEASVDATPEASAEAPPEAAAARTSNPSDAGGGECWSCSAELPVRSDLQYCPFCGCDQTAPECLNCQAGLEMAWSYCPACGTATGRS